MRDKMTIADALGAALAPPGSGEKPQRDGVAASSEPLGQRFIEPDAACVLPLPVEPLPAALGPPSAVPPEMLPIPSGPLPVPPVPVPPALLPVPLEPLPPPELLLELKPLAASP
jgi:hypothetical protein